jgi:hypothetical protein
MLLLLNLSYAPTSRYRSDTGTIIVGIIGVIQVRDKFHISRKHTIAQGLRQASRDKISIKDDAHHRESTESTERIKTQCTLPAPALPVGPG